jgi:hypothetical protein
MFLLNGNPLALDTPFMTEDGTQYPANWLRLTTAEEKTAIGITEVPDPVRADDRFYWDGDVNNPKDLDGLKTQFVEQVNQNAGSILAQTDWMVIRKVERAVDIPVDVAEYRADVVAKSNELVVAINAVTTVEELIALDLSFPVKE